MKRKNLQTGRHYIKITHLEQTAWEDSIDFYSESHTTVTVSARWT